MNEKNQIEILERIAVALEKIASNFNKPSVLFEYANTKNNGKEDDEINSSEEIAESVQEEIKVTNDINPILRFLSDKNIQVKNFQTNEEIDDVLDNIALFMGNRYYKIKKVYDKIRRTINTGKGFRIDLKNAPQDEISSSCQFCNSLHRIAFLSEYKYFKSPKYIINAKPNLMPTAINFFTGQWLERFIKTEIINNINKIGRPVQFAYLTNPQIILPNGNDFELDVLFSIEDEIFWFEAKTGSYQNYVAKYSEMSKLLGLDNNHAFMVLADVTEQDCKALKKLFKMEVVNIERFSETFTDKLEHFKEEENAL